jgi:hypothetical protein
MKRKITIAFMLTIGIMSVFSQNVNIPDANFKAYLVGNTAINTNSDNEIQVSEASAFTGGISCINLNIADLTGIEAFTALTSLSLGINQLTSLDVSANTALISLECNYNQITSLDVSTNTSLIYLYCTGNQLTSLDISNNLTLRTLYCNTNQITSLDVSANTLLQLLDCSYNLLTSLNVSSNIGLKTLYCYNNLITNLDISSNSYIEELFCSNNELTNLDVTSNTLLKRLECSLNQLTSLNVANTNNSIIIFFKASSNPNLTCIQVDDITYSTTNWVGDNFLFDTQSSFTEGVQTSLNGNIISIDSPSSSAIFQWVDCNNSNAPISGATSQSFTPSVTGSYAVEVTENGCSLTSSCIQVTIQGVGINENELATFTIYPNPATEQLTISNIEAGSTVVLVDVTGKVVSQVIASSTAINVETSNFTPGVYFVTVSGLNGTQKLVIE